MLKLHATSESRNRIQNGAEQSKRRVKMKHREGKSKSETEQIRAEADAKAKTDKVLCN